MRGGRRVIFEITNENIVTLAISNTHLYEQYQSSDYPLFKDFVNANKYEVRCVLEEQVNPRE